MSPSKEFFQGFLRPDGQAGTRNYVGVVSTVTCANQAAEDIARHVGGTVAFTHQQGCGLLREDLELTQRALTNLGRNPNLGAVLVISLGCEGVNVDAIVTEIAASGKPVELVRIQREGGYLAAVAEGRSKAGELVGELSSQKREALPIRKLRVGVKCGASDPTSGLASNPAVGKAVDQLIEAGASAVFGETTELIGAEHLVASRCETGAVADRLLQAIREVESHIIEHGSEMRGGNPSAGNIAAGLTTIEEKSLGAIVKSGSAPLRAVYDYGERPCQEGGLYFVDSPGREPELLAALGAAGCQVILFSTGIGAPQGFPFIPVIKVSGNRNTVSKLADFIDLDVSHVLLSGESLESAGTRIVDSVVHVASGDAVKAEATGYTGSTALYQRGPIV